MFRKEVFKSSTFQFPGFFSHSTTKRNIFNILPYECNFAILGYALYCTGFWVYGTGAEVKRNIFSMLLPLDTKVRHASLTRHSHKKTHRRHRSVSTWRVTERNLCKYTDFMRALFPERRNKQPDSHRQQTRAELQSGRFPSD